MVREPEEMLSIVVAESAGDMAILKRTAARRRGG
jgi:hypothetical protein